MVKVKKCPAYPLAKARGTLDNLNQVTVTLFQATQKPDTNFISGIKVGREMPEPNPALSAFADILSRFLKQKTAKASGVTQKRKGANQLLYLVNPFILLVPPTRIERVTPGLGILCSIP